MFVTKLRTWAVVAILVTLQAPVMFAVKAAGTSPKKKARIDRQIEQIEQSAGTTTGTVSVIVRSDGTADWASLLKTLKSKGVTVGRQARRANAISLTISSTDLAWLETLPGVGSISIDAPVFTAPLAAQDILTGADLGKAVKKASDLRSQLGLTDADPTGAGIGIAIIDSGIAPVPDLASRITAFYDFTNGQNAVATAPVDGYGHGTHVAGLAAGDGTLSNGQFSGVAPDAHLIGLRVLDNSGGGSTSDVVAAVEFATVNKDALGIDVINMSLGHPPFQPAADDPMVQAVEAASRAGIIVVVSAGNAGVNPSTGLVGYGGILAPGNAPSAFTIASAKTQGTVDPNDDLIANYSSRGPTWIDGFAKPDFAVPGHNLVAPFAPGSYLGVTYPSLLVNDASGHKTYISLTGTSMAAGVETGLVAVLLQASRETSAELGITQTLSGNALKAFSEYSAFTMHNALGVTYDQLSQGAGRVNGAGLLSLVRSVDPSVPAGSPWIIGQIVPSSIYNGVVVPWEETDSCGFALGRWREVTVKRFPHVASPADP